MVVAIGRAEAVAHEDVEGERRAVALAQVVGHVVRGDVAAEPHRAGTRAQEVEGPDD